MTAVHLPLAELGDFNSFLRRNHFILVTWERSRHSSAPPFYAYLNADTEGLVGATVRTRVDLMEGKALVSATGDGATLDDAILDLQRKILGRTLVVGGWSPNRRYVQCPNQWKEEGAERCPCRSEGGVK